jgi:hypothetical protein
MHDYIHAAIAAQRVKERVEAAEAQRATRRPRRTRSAPAVEPAQPPAPAELPGGRIAALLRLRPWLG